MTAGRVLSSRPPTLADVPTNAKAVTTTARPVTPRTMTSSQSFGGIGTSTSYGSSWVDGTPSMTVATVRHRVSRR
ncbi:hypothetical protein B0E38_04760 [Streptomyces sp. 111WW2]|nr:hypothetical protein B0E38_04760 [Streptomyces sp. 111WW2]